MRESHLGRDTRTLGRLVTKTRKGGSGRRRTGSSISDGPWGIQGKNRMDRVKTKSRCAKEGHQGRMGGINCRGGHNSFESSGPSLRP